MWWINVMLPWTSTLWVLFMLLSSPLMQVITVPFSAGKVRVEVKLPLTTPTGRARKFPETFSLLPGARVISFPGNFQMTAPPGRVHWKITSSPEHGNPCCVRCTSLQAGKYNFTSVYSGRKTLIRSVCQYLTDNWSLVNAQFGERKGSTYRRIFNNLY